MRIFLAALVFLAFFGLDGAYFPAEAKRHAARHISTASKPQYNPKYAAFVVDGDTGKILYQEDAGQLRHPASLTKMMTLYLLFEALENKKLKMDTVLTASEYAATRPKTNLAMQAGDKILVRDVMLAIIVKSANDCAVIASETLGGDEQNFAKIMNKRAKQLGMKNTHFENASGLHDPQQVTTAKDMALLGIALKKHFPQYFPYFSRREFTYNGVNFKGHNHVMEEYPGADGLKTGFVNASGFNLVTTASRRGINLVGVVLGGRTHQSRDDQMMRLLDDGFQKAATLKNQAYVASDYKAAPAPVKNDDEDAPDNDNGSSNDTPPAVGAVVRSRPSTPIAVPTPVPTPVPSPGAGLNSRSEIIDRVVADSEADEKPAMQQPADNIDQNEQKRNRMLAEAASNETTIESYEANTSKYVRTVASSKLNKTQRYKSNMMIQPQPLTGNASEPLFIPSPKSKPKL